ncbi:hypothetical protein BBJ28_00009875, partial [Nothophytophthora sp. Chile5]
LTAVIMSFKFPRWGRKKKAKSAHDPPSANKYYPTPAGAPHSASGRTMSNGSDFPSQQSYQMQSAGAGLPPAPASSRGMPSSRGVGGGPAPPPASARGAPLPFVHPLYAMDEDGMVHLKATGKGLDDSDLAVHQDEIINAVVKYVQDSMRKELGFREAFIPANSTPEAPVKANVFVSRNFETCKKLLVFVAVSRGLYPGLWSRGLVLHAGVKSGSMLEYFRKALDEGYGIIVANPNKNVIVLRDGKQRLQIPGSSSPEEHMDSLWDSYVARSSARRVYFLGYSYGGVLIKYLLQSRGDQLMRRNGAIALIESSHRIEDGDSQSVKSILAHRTMYWESNDALFQTKLDGDAPHRTGCTCLSAGRPPRAHANHYYVTAFCINKIQDALFRFLDTRDATTYVAGEKPVPEPPVSAPAYMGNGMGASAAGPGAPMLQRQDSRREANNSKIGGSEKHCNLCLFHFTLFDRRHHCRIAVSEPICFGDVVKLETKSAFVENGVSSCLGFLELPGKNSTQLLVVPPVKEDVAERFLEAEFIMCVSPSLLSFLYLISRLRLVFSTCCSAPIRGEKQQSIGTPLTYATPFVLRTSDGKDGSTYSLNNKVAGQRDAVSLQLSATKGEMYMQVEKEGCTNEATCVYGDEGLQLNVVDSNRIRKTLNHVLTHMTKPKSDAPGGFVSCGAKGQPLAFRIQRALNADGQPLTETRKYIKNPQPRRSSMDALTPGKMDELSRADRIDSSEFSDVDALSRSSSVAGMNSNPASPRGGQGAQASLVDPAAVAALLPLPEGKDGVSASEETEATASSVVEAPASPAKTAAAVTAKPSTVVSVPAASPAKTKAAAVATPAPAQTSPVKTAAKSTPPPAKEPTAVIPTVSTTTTAATVPTFPPAPAIYGPAPAPVAAVSPKKTTTTTTTTTDATAKPLSTAGATKLNEEEVAALKAEAEVEKMDPACAASCAVM